MNSVAVKNCRGPASWFPGSHPMKKTPTERWQPSLASCTAQFLPCMVFPLPAIFQCCLGHPLLPNATSLLAPQLFPPRPVLLESCYTGVQEMRAEPPVSSVFLGLRLLLLTSVFFRFPSLVTFYHRSCFFN